MMRRRWVLVLFVMFLLIALTGCSDEAEPEVSPEEESPVEEETTVTETEYPLEVTDDADRRVVIPEKPQRVVSFAPSNTEILFSLGAGDTLVAVDDWSDWPAPDLEDIPRIGGVENPNYETILDLEPDLVLSIGGTDEFVSRLEELGIPAIVLQPTSFEDIYENLSLVGDVMDAPDRADEVVESMRSTVATVEETVATVPEEERPTVFFEVWRDPLMTTGPDSFIGFLVRTAGGCLISEDVQGDWVEFSLETLVDRDPEVIITTFADSIDEFESGSRPGWEDVKAVREGRYHMVDVEIVTHPSPRILEGLEEIAGILYPELFE
ncbi:MAG: ABC transporter substrate-binding protein [Bacillota bacterium]